VDLHRYLRPERVAETLAFLRANPATVRAVLADAAGAAVVDERLAELARLTTAADVFRTLPIVYRAPADAAHLDLPAGSTDVLGWRPYLDEGARRALAKGLPLAPQFRRMSPEDLCVSQVRILSRPTRRG